MCRGPVEASVLIMTGVLSRFRMFSIKNILYTLWSEDIACYPHKFS